MVHNNFSIRLAIDEDFDEIYSIWKDGIYLSFDTSLIDQNEIRDKFRSNFFRRFGIFNYWVAVSESEEIAGWQSLNKCTVNPLKENSFAESSTYVKKEFRKFGIGEMLLNYVIEISHTSTVEYITAYVTVANTAIRTITKNLGFVEIGQIPKGSKSLHLSDKIFIIKSL